MNLGPLVNTPSRPADQEQGLKDILQGHRFQIEHARLARKPAGRRIHFFLRHRAHITQSLRHQQIGLKPSKPLGAYYIMTDVSPLGFEDDVQAAHHLVSEVGVATVPGSSF